MIIAKRNIDNINKLESLNAERPQVDIETIERFMGSMYVREIIIPKGCTITSRVYKRQYVDVMLSGDITITDSNGTYRLEGYNCLEGTCGRKRAGYAHEETRWLTVHDARDIKKSPLEDISLETIEDYDEFRGKEDREDFGLFLENNNLDPEVLSSQSSLEPYRPIAGDFYLSDSPIHGKGVYTNKPFRAGESLGKTVVGGEKTQLGRYVNHSKYPNSTYYNDELVVIRFLDSGKEITVDYGLSERLK